MSRKVNPPYYAILATFQIHIRNFEVEEIELWSDLDHPYIVKLYGAIRHGEMIYIFSEFIDGRHCSKLSYKNELFNPYIVLFSYHPMKSDNYSFGIVHLKLFSSEPTF